ncbi:molybdopterin-synthase adenylyltransferase MoeB [Fulvimarina endophytica]|uniref:Molybdopterin-synthase adenylyltransferase n=1 Tax=Fulvimarina endophytica TaxID=2293836 RepID=A0A371WZQ7_9HYPH|nr:molybdopterin-synthase adenylyltransferase MoeB [Fulvimarina endophytica]RFC62483.1 molybdopterin-synthase adenylyltransferase MoeB [Fulvimarina endophytica]
MNDAMLSASELERYARHIVLPEIGGPGQQKLKAARVLVVGAGGIGSPVALYLAAAGIGTLVCADDDVVSLSNLQRQVLHGTENVGETKLESAERAVARINPHVRFEAFAHRITRENGADLVGSCDLVVDGSDNFATRYGMADLCEERKVPLVTAAVQRFSGSLTVLAPHRTDSEGRPLPRYRDLFPEAPPAGTVPSCAEAGILGTTTGVLGTLAASEAVKMICDTGEPLLGRFLMVDLLAMRFETIRYRRMGARGT